MVIQSISIQCTDTQRTKFIQPPVVFFRVLSFCHEQLRPVCYITDLIYDACNRISVRVVFHFMLSQSPLPTFSCYTMHVIFGRYNYQDFILGYIYWHQQCQTSRVNIHISVLFIHGWQEQSRSARADFPFASIAKSSFVLPCIHLNYYMETKFRKPSFVQVPVCEINGYHSSQMLLLPTYENGRIILTSMRPISSILVDTLPINRMSKI